ncbi:MAG: TIGR02449 family protein [Coxiella-like endosymbiont]
MQATHMIELSALEDRINYLLRYLKRLKAENNGLQRKVAMQVREQSLLVEKNLQAAQKIKKLITQLREAIL